MIPDNMPAKWKSWFAARRPTTQQAIAAAWDAIGADPEIAHTHRNADYARRSRLLAHCADKRGYKP